MKFFVPPFVEIIFFVLAIAAVAAVAALVYWLVKRLKNTPVDAEKAPLEDMTDTRR